MAEQQTLNPNTVKILPWIVAVSFFMQMLDTTIMNTALPSIAKDLNESPLGMQSVVICYMLTVAFIMPVSGWVADRFGVRNVFIFANAVFVLGSLLSALSPTLMALVLSRIVQGIGGAFLMPVGRLAVLKVFPRSQLTDVLSFISVPALMGPLIGPTLGGFLAQYASWHWIFLINIPVGIVACLASMRYMPALKVSGLARFDWSGFLLIGAAILSGTLGIEASTDLHLPLAYTLPLVVFSLAMLALYVFHAHRAPFPLFDLKVFKIRSFSVGILGNIFARLASGVMPFMTPLLLQVGLGFTPSKAGLLLMPAALMSIAGKKLVSPLLKRMGFRLFLCINTLLVGVLLSLYSTITAETPVWLLILQFSAFGIVNSMQFTAMFSLPLIDLPAEYASSGNSILSVVTQLSMGLGVGVGAAVLAFFAGPQGSGQSIDAFHKAYLCIGLFGIAAAAIFLFIPKDTGRISIESAAGE